MKELSDKITKTRKEERKQAIKDWLVDLGLIIIIVVSIIVLKGC